jgi:hypothetical protein
MRELLPSDEVPRFHRNSFGTRGLRLALPDALLRKTSVSLNLDLAEVLTYVRTAVPGR